MSKKINIGFWFYKKYYKKISDNEWEKLITAIDGTKIDDSINKEILKQELSNDFVLYFKMQKVKEIDLKTIYPGLLIGSGYQHESSLAGEFKLGFYFDYTTGLPVIPGSSVKGLLRSAFPGREKKYKSEKENYVTKIIHKKLGHTNINIDVTALENQIFEGVKDGRRIPIYNRDIFFEAYPIVDYNEKQKFLSDDYITPHKKPLKNPIPIKFLKILPDIKFRFQFRLNDFDKNITAEIKKELFKQILLDLGIGAKSNIGFGKFV